MPLVIEGNGSAIATGVKGDVEIPHDGTIIRCTVLLDNAPNGAGWALQVWKASYSAYPPTASNLVATISVSSGASKASSTLAIPVAAGDVIRYYVSSRNNFVTRASVSLIVQAS